MAYLDLTERATGIPYATLKKKLGGILEIYEKFVGVDPLLEPMKIYPAIHYSMGGMWVDFVKDEKTGGLVHGHPRNQSTNIPGLYAAGEADYQYHGANRLGANSLLSCLTTGLLMGPCVKNYMSDIEKGSVTAAPQSLFDAAVKEQTDVQNWLLNTNGDQNPYLLHRELGRSMSDNVTIIRVNRRMRETLALIEDLKGRYKTRLGLPDKSLWSNQSLTFSRTVWDMLLLSEAITKAAIARDESRGAHYKIPDEREMHLEIPLDVRSLQRNDEEWLKSTLVSYEGGAAVLSYEPVDISLVTPRARTYGKTVATETKKEEVRAGGTPVGQTV